MTRLPISRAAAALLRALIARAQVSADRILLIEARSTDWQSLTFTGEQHHLTLAATGADAEATLNRLAEGIEDAEFALAGHIVADIRAERMTTDAGAVELAIEALTIVE